MERCRSAFRGRSTSQPTTTFMSPSSIYHLHAELAVAGLCSDITNAVSSTTAPGVAELMATDMARLPTLRVQAVEKDGCWFALDSAQLELCRRLERGGVCRQVRVDVVSCRELPDNVRNLIKPPPRIAVTTASCVTAAAAQQTSATASSKLPCPVTSSQTALASAAAPNSHLATRTSSTCTAFIPNANRSLLSTMYKLWYVKPLNFIGHQFAVFLVLTSSSASASSSLKQCQTAL